MYEKQIEAIVSYIRRGEKDPSRFGLGMEIEHLVLYEDSLEAVSYSGEEGIEGLLKELVGLRWRPVYEEGRILGLKSPDASISIEPGGQLEISIAPQKCLFKIDVTYKSFLCDVLPILRRRGQIMVACGYQPQTSIRDIQLLPKERYRYMYDYFAKNGRKYAHNMMKGTASLQISVDYADEEDYVKKYRAAAFLTPVIYTIFDNSPFFEGRILQDTSVRSMVWSSCDPDRCGLPDGIFSSTYGYAAYARRVLVAPPILIKRGGRLIFTGRKLLSEVFNPEEFTPEEVDYILSMFFFDVRTRNYIEIRAGDSLPYPYSMAYAAFLKGLMYGGHNVEMLQELAIKFNKQEEACSLPVLFGDLLDMAREGLQKCERRYLEPLEQMMRKRLKPKEITLRGLEKGKKNALAWCILDEDTCCLKGCECKIACC